MLSPFGDFSKGALERRSTFIKLLGKCTFFINRFIEALQKLFAVLIRKIVAPIRV